MTPEQPDAASEGGDPVCWLARVCDACGRLADDPGAQLCERCGEPLRREDG